MMQLVEVDGIPCVINLENLGDGQGLGGSLYKHQAMHQKV